MPTTEEISVAIVEKWVHPMGLVLSPYFPVDSRTCEPGCEKTGRESNVNTRARPFSSRR